MLCRKKSKAFEVNLHDLQPSQLYISEEKLAAVESTIGELDNWKDTPVPVKHFNSRMVLIDGHTRALAAFRQGRGTIWAYWETDELDWEAYQICVRWCVDEGVESIADLETRIVSTKQYEDLWLTRCRAMHDALALDRKAQQVKPKPFESNF